MEAVGRILVAVAKAVDAWMTDRLKPRHWPIGEILVDVLVIPGQGQLERRRRAPDPFAPRSEAMVDFTLILLSGEQVRPIAAGARQAHGKVARDPIASPGQKHVAPE